MRVCGPTCKHYNPTLHNPQIMRGEPKILHSHEFLKLGTRLYFICILLFHCDGTCLYFIAFSILLCYFIVMVHLKQEKLNKKNLCMVSFLSRTLVPHKESVLHDLNYEGKEENLSVCLICIFIFCFYFLFLF